MKVLISAGETSSDMYGAQLIEAMRALDPSVEFFGVGGERMRAAGADTVVDSRHLAVVGIVEILSHLPRIYAEFGKLIRAAEQRKPDLAVVIDSPGFNFRVAREMHARGVPVVYFVCPQIWAWRPGRIERFHKWVKKALVIFPFEEKWYRERNVDAEYVGHPLADLPEPAITREEFARQNTLDAGKQWIALLPGSRKKEVRLNLPTMLDAAERLAKQGDYEFVLPVAALLSREWMQQQIGSGLKVTLVGDARALLKHARAAIVASGTATVETALSGTPFVVVYRVSGLTYWMGKRLLEVPFVAMPNLIVGEKIVPELIQQDFTADNVVREMAELLADGPRREKMLADLARVRQQLHRAPRPGEADRRAVERAAELIFRAIRS